MTGFSGLIQDEYISYGDNQNTGNSRHTEFVDDYRPPANSQRMLPVGRNDAVNIVSFVLSETAASSPMYLRNYNLHVRPDDIFTLQDMVEGVGAISSIEVANSLPSLMSLDNEPQSMAVIPNGWDTKRFRFMLVTEEITGGGTVFMNTYQGYTSYMDISYNNQLDPNMELYINSVIISKVSPNGYEEPVLAYTVLENHNQDGYLVEDKELSAMLRPQDVVLSLGSDSRFSDYNSTVINTSSMIRSGPSASIFNNAIGPEHLAKTLNGAIDASLINGDNNMEHTGLNAVGIVRDPNPKSLALLKEMSRAYQTNATSVINYGQLKALYPYIENDDVCQVLLMSQKQQGRRNDVENLGSARIESSIAQTLADGATAVAANCGIDFISFHVNPSTLSNPPVITLVHGANVLSRFRSSDLSKQIRRFMSEFTYTTYNTVSECFKFRIDATITLSIASGEVYVDVSYEGYPTVQYTFHNWANSLYTPIRMSNENAKRNISGYGQLIAAVTGI